MVCIKKLDITSHVLVPKFRKLSPEEVTELLQKYNISLDQLPEILAKDPMAIAVDAKVNDVIRIERKTVTGTAPHFRRVLP